MPLLLDFASKPNYLHDNSVPTLDDLLMAASKMTEIRKGQAPGPISREEFGVRYRTSFRDPAFAPEKEAIERIEQIAWLAYADGRKSPITRKAGPGYADPDYDLSVDWIAAREAIDAAQAIQANPASPSKVLLVNGSTRNDGTCPGEISKTFRLATSMTEELEGQGMIVDTLDLSLVALNTVAGSTRARAVCPPRCPCATGPAVAIRTTRWVRLATG